jgi:hypothetical protein
MGVTLANMADDELDIAQKEHEVYLDERKQLIDAARESARTFDKAVLTFGSAVFGFSIAFLKDIAPNPAPDTLKWLGASWLLFSLGLLAILMSFLFSHRACLFEIEDASKALTISGYQHKWNPWSIITTWCNLLCVVLLFLGLLCWSVFAFDNLSRGDMPVNKVQTPTEKKGYVPPSRPAPAPQQQQAPQQQAPQQPTTTPSTTQPSPTK